MRLWRISEWTTLDGEGGLSYDGRWHSASRPVTYMAGSSALAMLEMLVRQPRTLVPTPYQLLEIEAPDDLPAITWHDDRDHCARSLTAAWGDAFLEGVEVPLARVPSVIAPASWNYLLNPLHPDATQVRIVRAERYPWDTRLFDR